MYGRFGLGGIKRVRSDYTVPLYPMYDGQFCGYLGMWEACGFEARCSLKSSQIPRYPRHPHTLDTKGYRPFGMCIIMLKGYALTTQVEDPNALYKIECGNHRFLAMVKSTLGLQLLNHITSRAGDDVVSSVLAEQDNLIGAEKSAQPPTVLDAVACGETHFVAKMKCRQEKSMNAKKAKDKEGVSPNTSPTVTSPRNHPGPAQETHPSAAHACPVSSPRNPPRRCPVV